jgi:hypothetical protein
MFTKRGDAAVLAKLGEAPAQYREIGERLHAIIRETAPSLEPIVRWGLPFYVKDGKDVCYTKPDKEFIAVRVWRGRESRSRGGREHAPGRVDPHLAGRHDGSQDSRAHREGGGLIPARAAASALPAMARRWMAWIAESESGP